MQPTEERAPARRFKKPTQIHYTIVVSSSVIRAKKMKKRHNLKRLDIHTHHSDNSRCKKGNIILPTGPEPRRKAALYAKSLDDRHTHTHIIHVTNYAHEPNQAGPPQTNQPRWLLSFTRARAHPHPLSLSTCQRDELHITKRVEERESQISKGISTSPTIHYK